MKIKVLSNDLNYQAFSLTIGCEYTLESVSPESGVYLLLDDLSTTHVVDPARSMQYGYLWEIVDYSKADPMKYHEGDLLVNDYDVFEIVYVGKHAVMLRHTLADIEFSVPLEEVELGYTRKQPKKWYCNGVKLSPQPSLDDIDYMVKQDNLLEFK